MHLFIKNLIFRSHHFFSQLVLFLLHFLFFCELFLLLLFVVVVLLFGFLLDLKFLSLLVRDLRLLLDLFLLLLRILIVRGLGVGDDFVLFVFLLFDLLILFFIQVVVIVILVRNLMSLFTFFGFLLLVFRIESEGFVIDIFVELVIEHGELLLLDGSRELRIRVLLLLEVNLFRLVVLVVFVDLLPAQLLEVLLPLREVVLAHDERAQVRRENLADGVVSDGEEKSGVDGVEDPLRLDVLLALDDLRLADLVDGTVRDNVRDSGVVDIYVLRISEPGDESTVRKGDELNARLRNLRGDPEPESFE